MLKTTILLEKSTFKRLGIGDNKVNRFGVDGDEEITRKSRNLKSKKLSKSQKSAKSEKNCQKLGIYPILML